MKTLEYVRQFLKMGIAIMPLYHRSKEPMLPTWREYQSRLPTNTEYRSWFPTDWNNYAVICGWQNLVVIDFDSMFYFDLWRECVNASVASGFKVRTQKGMHVYVCTSVACGNDKRIAKSAGIDVQAQGKYVVGPLSTHPSGHVYEPLGKMHFPMVQDIESILPLDLFPRVASDPVVFTGAAPEFHTNNTEYQCDPFADTRDLIAKVKASVRIESLYQGVQRSSTDGRWLKALCPFHKDNHQSAWIDVQRQLAGCQVCGMKPMDVINVYARMKNVSVSVAVSMLAEEVGVWR